MDSNADLQLWVSGKIEPTIALIHRFQANYSIQIELINKIQMVPCIEARCIIALHNVLYFNIFVDEFSNNLNNLIIYRIEQYQHHGNFRLTPDRETNMVWIPSVVAPRRVSGFPKPMCLLFSIKYIAIRW
jgi:hypothetical protein